MNSACVLSCFQFILDKLFWPETALLESVGAHEPQVETLRTSIEKAIAKSLIPLKYNSTYIT